MKFTYALRLFKEIFFPRKCAVCESEIDTGIVCSACRQNYLLHKSKIYGASQNSWHKLMTTGQPLEAEDFFDRVVYLYRYDSAFKAALHKVKFEAEAALLPLLKEEAEIALQEIRNSLLKHYDIVICIPTSSERLKQRGFDVPKELFESLIMTKNKTITGDALQRIKKTAPLYTMDAEARKEELVGCFKITSGVNLQHKRVLLCDDIFTTGSTMKEAAQLLLEAGAACVGVLTFCASKDNWD